MLKKRIPFFIVGSAVILLTIWPVVAEGHQPPLDLNNPADLTCPSTYNDQSGNLPAWVKRLEFSAIIETHQKPSVYFQTVQPLYQDASKTNTVFIQPRYTIQNDRSLYNLGVGYRRLVSENLILGLNAFGDYQELHRHGRVGIGGEAIGQVLEARVNGYFGVTPKRLVDDSGGVQTYERVANGFDYELGSRMPYLPWLKVYAGGFWYDYNHSTNAVGWKSRLEATLSNNIRLEFYSWDDNKGPEEFGGQLRYTISFTSWQDIFKGFKLFHSKFPHQDLKKELLVPVERSYSIRVERSTTNQATGLTVEAGRA